MNFQIGQSLQQLDAWEMECHCVDVFKKSTFFKRAFVVDYRVQLSELCTWVMWLEPGGHS